MAGNPDQQEDTLDDQYQEEVEDEVWNTDALTHTLYIRNKCVKNCMSRHYMRLYICIYIIIFTQFLCLVFGVLKAQEDIAGEQKREEEVEEEGEDPYNEDNMEQVGSSAGKQNQEISVSSRLKAFEILQYRILSPLLNLVFFPSKHSGFNELLRSGQLSN